MSMPVEVPARPKHSGLGLASLFLFLVYTALFLFFLLTSVVLAMYRDPQTMPPLPSLILILLCLQGFANVFLSLVGVCLGIAGAAQRNRRKVFAVLGIVCNGGVILFAGFMLLRWFFL